jgi:hypothetical protein
VRLIQDVRVYQDVDCLPGGRRLVGVEVLDRRTMWNDDTTELTQLERMIREI